MKTVISTAKKAAKAKLPVLLIGETGTGKDLIAESIHNELSPSNTYSIPCSVIVQTQLLIERLDEDLNDAGSSYIIL